MPQVSAQYYLAQQLLWSVSLNVIVERQLDVSPKPRTGHRPSTSILLPTPSPPYLPENSPTSVGDSI